MSKQRDSAQTLGFVIVGHVDHGKSTLIGRLLYDTNSLPQGKVEEIRALCKDMGKETELGYLLDHLQEEREQGITIDTTQTFFRTPKRQYVIIDAPGHREFVKNMITGASQAEAAILIVDVNEGVEEQTRRHAYIMTMLGLGQIIVVINKMDLIGYEKKRFDKVKKDILHFLGSIRIKPSHMIPISAKEGSNVAKKSGKMSWYTGPTVLDALDTFRPKESSRDKPLRFPVQDVYKFWDKRIIAGRVESGYLETGDNIVVLPSGEKTVVNSIESYSRVKNSAEAGESIGITTRDKLFLERGNIIVRPGNAPKTTDRIKGHVFWVEKIPLQRGERLILKCATQEVMAEVKRIARVTDSSSLEVLGTNVDVLKDKEVGDLVLKTEQPIVAENFNSIEELGRFVLERRNNVCAGGIIT